MHDSLIAVLIFYPLIGSGFSLARWIEWDDNNIARLVIIGASWPIVIAYYVYRSGHVIRNYFMRRFWREIAELTPKHERKAAAEIAASEHQSEYVEGQWR